MEVCLVGAGPRGLSVLERLCAQERKSPRWSRVTVHVVDPDPPGSGRVWRPSQSRHLLMNTVASQVTVFTDDSVSIEGPLEEGPSLYQWAKDLAARPTTGPVPAGATAPDTAAGPAAVPPSAQVLAEARALGPDTYPTRVLYGQYLTWAFGHVIQNAAAHVTVRVHPVRAVRLENGQDNGTGRDGEAGAGGADGWGGQTVVLEDGTRLTGLSAVVLAQGHVPARPSAAERELAGFAARHGLTYIAPANPADVDLSVIAPGQEVLLRGLGLNFFDYLALFTHARGGVFVRDGGGRLVYRPSGREPVIHAGSRRGVPYQARGENEKGPHGRYLPRLLTAQYVAALRERAACCAPVRFSTDLWPLIAKEVQSVYYETLITRRHGPEKAAQFAAHYLAAEPGDAEEEVLGQAGIGAHERWDWQKVARPYQPHALYNLASFRTWLRGYLDRDVAMAREGNVSGPFKAALDLLRDLRNEVRLAVDHGGLDAASHRDELDQWYTPLNAYLSIGPPASRIEEMAALMDAGVLQVTGPGIRITADPGGPGGPCFLGTSRAIPDVAVRATALIEGRLPETDLRRTADPLMSHLLRTGQCRPYTVTGADGQDYETGGLAVTPRPYHLLDASGAAHPRRFAYGVPTESVHWVTAAGIRPGVGSVTLEDSDAIAAAVLALPEPTPSGQSASPARHGTHPQNVRSEHGTNSHDGHDGHDGGGRGALGPATGAGAPA
ncbi:FAD/NAD(P)-binding protein [Streptomyces sp. KK5PA1]|uniref:FAD/NAD(P)-binding protein n=2 Tax=Actinacidiphila acididurans TaxID=2784346 RepID=A0ABS2TUE7_9ACTN|nr:FAD/NAD(P)-binding protein [Actinacidiphila acididurans]